MEKHKLKYLKEFLKRTNVISMEDFIAMVKDNEAKLRDCYAETIQMGSNEFVEMILVDATFIIELLLKVRDVIHGEFINDFIVESRMVSEVMKDMLMLENQIPYFVLRNIYDAAKINLSSNSKGNDEVEEEKWQLSIIALFYNCFKRFFPGEYKLKQLFHSEFLHFLDFFKIAYQPVRNPRKTKIKSIKKWSITELEQAGVKFRALDLTKNNMFDVKFQNGILQIPKLMREAGTDILLLNLVAFEQCHCDTSFLSDYAIFIDFLINTEKDIEILTREEVLDAWSSDDTETVKLFNIYASSCYFNPNNFFYAGVLEDLDNYCKVPRHHWKFILQRNYFNTPWAIISFIAAAVLLIFTVVQTVWAITHP